MLSHHVAQHTRIVNRAAKLIHTLAYPNLAGDRAVSLDSSFVGKFAHARQQLSVRERLVLDLFHHEELTIQEVATVTGIDELTVLRVHEQAMTILTGFMAKA